MYFLQNNKESNLRTCIILHANKCYIFSIGSIIHSGFCCCRHYSRVSIIYRNVVLYKWNSPVSCLNFIRNGIKEKREDNNMMLLKKIVSFGKLL